MFNVLDGDTVIVYAGGAYRQLPLCSFAGAENSHLNGALFCKDGARYFRLAARGDTSNPRMKVFCIETTAEMYKDRFGRLTLIKKGNEPLTPMELSTLRGE